MKELGRMIDSLAPILMIVGAILVAIAAGLSLGGVIGAALVGSGFASVIERVTQIARHPAGNSKP